MNETTQLVREDGRPRVRSAPPAAEEVLITIKEASRRLSLGLTKTRGLVASGEIDSVKIGRNRRIRPEALEEFVRKHEERR